MSKLDSEKNLQEFLIDEINSMTEEELDADFEELGVDINSELKVLNSIVEKNALALRKNRLAQAKKQLEETRSREQKIGLLERLKREGKDAKQYLIELMVQGKLAGELTVAFRDGKELSDEEAEGMIGDLIELGAITDEEFGRKR